MSNSTESSRQLPHNIVETKQSINHFQVSSTEFAIIFVVLLSFRRGFLATKDIKLTNGRFV